MKTASEEKLLQGVMAYENGRLKDAATLFRIILESDSGNPDANHNLGVLLMQSGDSKKAVRMFQNALESNPDVPQFWLSYVEGLIRGQQYEKLESAIKKASIKGVTKEALLLLLKETVFVPPEENDASNPAYIGSNPELQNTLGNIFKNLGNLEDAKFCYEKAIKIRPTFAGAHNNLGNTLKELGRLQAAEDSYLQAIKLDPDFAGGYNNLGNTLKEQGRVREARECYMQALKTDRRLSAAYWNLASCERTMSGADSWLSLFLHKNERHLEAKILKAGLEYFLGNPKSFRAMSHSELKSHPLFRSLLWVSQLPVVPELHFNRWDFFDSMITRSPKSRPFYEFGVWRGNSFNYLLKHFQEGFGFDTFMGLPEDWIVGQRVEKEGTYSNDGLLPELEGGTFIKGVFEDTLPKFFSRKRPMASLINFDADLYSSTICAMNFSRQVIDNQTILVFDQFLVNESWEDDEHRALEEFCASNKCEYEVLAVSFFTKQVAVRLI